jgi:hypothetical protein
MAEPFAATHETPFHLEFSGGVRRLKTPNEKISRRSREQDKGGKHVSFDI